ncbi:MAG: hypothetical protein VB009_00710 [Erysipelotrichaceae bacterium]|nr:hypothetical protein [Erysipelotrichaceae bacterium]
MKEQFIELVRCFSKRRTSKQKRRFIQNVYNMFTGLGYKVKISEKSMGFKKIRNIIIGDIDVAETIYVAGYDTTDQIILNSNDYYPLNTRYNVRSYMKNTIIRFLISSVFSLIGIYSLYYSANYPLASSILPVFFGLIFIGLGTWFSYGISNTTNFSKSSSIFIILNLAKHEKSSSIAYVLCDQASYSEIGLDFLVDDTVKIKDKLIIYLDCLSRGEKLLLCSNNVKEIREMADHYSDHNIAFADLDNKYETRFKNFNNIIVISAGKLSDNNEFYVSDVLTKYDCSIDITLLNSVFHMLHNYNKNKKKEY